MYLEGSLKLSRRELFGARERLLCALVAELIQLRYRLYVAT
jgi:hypothetical protein